METIGKTITLGSMGLLFCATFGDGLGKVAEKPQVGCPSNQIQNIVEARKLEHSFRRISARIPYALP